MACGDDVIGPEDIAGTYTLQSIDGTGLPAVLSETGDPIFAEVTAGSVTLNQDMTCSDSVTTRRTMDGIVVTGTETHVCTYTFDGGDIALTIPFFGGSIFIRTGSISASTLTLSGISGSLNGSPLMLNNDGAVSIYEK